MVLEWVDEALRLPDGSSLLLHSEEIRGEPRHWWVAHHREGGRRAQRIPSEFYPVDTGRGHTTKAEARRAGLKYARSLG